jgi:hypothetical protein
LAGERRYLVSRTIAVLVVVGAVLAGAGGAWRVEAQAVKSQEELRKPFIGAWRLVSITGGTEVAKAARGAKPTGLIIYDAHGMMAAQIQPDRERPMYTGIPTPEQAFERMRGYTAYFGTYTVDPKANIVTHHRQGRLDANSVEYVRTFELSADGNRITLMPVGNEGPPTYLTWERVR